jgi:hypothetical protein
MEAAGGQVQANVRQGGRFSFCLLGHNQAGRSRQRFALDRSPSGCLKPVTNFLFAIHVPFTRHEQKRTRHECCHKWLGMCRVGPKID